MAVFIVKEKLNTCKRKFVAIKILFNASFWWQINNKQNFNFSTVSSKKFVRSIVGELGGKHEANKIILRDQT